MKNKALLEEIAKNNTIIDYHIKRLKKKPGQLHDIDIDLLSEKLKQIYSLVHELETETETVIPLTEEKKEAEVIEEKPVAEEIIEEKKEVVAEVKEIVVEPEPEPEPIPVPEPEPIPEPKPIIEKVVEEVAEEKPDPAPVVEAVTKEIPIVEEIIDEQGVAVEEEAIMSTPKTTADLFSGATTIADTYQKDSNTSMAAKTVQQPITDLKKAIGINDKFLFINELFKGDPTNYNIVIDKLNAIEEMAEAESMMKSYVNEYAWAEEGAAYQRLASLVQAKF